MDIAYYYPYTRPYTLRIKHLAELFWGEAVLLFSVGFCKKINKIFIDYKLIVRDSFTVIHYWSMSIPHEHVLAPHG